MFGFKKESVFDTQLVGVDESNCPITGMPSRYRLAVNWVDGQLSKGRESAKIAGLVMEEARKFASRIGESAAKRDSEIAALQAENSALNGTVCALRDSLDQACKDNEALQAELDDACEDADALCDALDEADELIASLEGVIAAMAQGRPGKKPKKGK